MPEGEQLYADVAVKNEDVGFTQVGQTAQIKLVAYPFQQYGMLKGKVIHLSADATDVGKQTNTATANGSSTSTADGSASSNLATYKAPHYTQLRCPARVR